MKTQWINWRLVLYEGLLSMIFSLGLAAGGSTLGYLWMATIEDQYEGQIFNMSYLEAAPLLATMLYVLFFLVAMLAFTRMRVHKRSEFRPRFHWLLAFLTFSLVGLLPGLIYWLLFAAADRPGI